MLGKNNMGTTLHVNEYKYHKPRKSRNKTDWSFNIKFKVNLWKLNSLQLVFF